MTRQESARQMRSPSLITLALQRSNKYPKPLLSEAELASTSLTSVASHHIKKEFNRYGFIYQLGIDIAKLKFDVCLIKENGKAKHKVFQNTRHGFEQLACWLASHKVTDLHACLEATGTYGEVLALFLYDAGFVVSLVNPAAVRAFASAGLSRTKTDSLSLWSSENWQAV
jgi:hypothetical protein